MKKIYFMTLGLLLAVSAFAQTVKVTFQVDMKYASVAPRGVYVVGNFQKDAGMKSDWNSNDTLARASNGGSGTIYTLKLTLKANKYYEYKFFNYNYEYIKCLSTFNRRITTGTKDTVISLVCFNQCGPCPANLVKVTFRVDMKHETIDSGGIRVTGDFQQDAGMKYNWSPYDSGVLARNGGTGSIYSLQVNLMPNTMYQYKYVNWDNNTNTGWEEFPYECALYNREITIGSTDTVLDVSCFGMCRACPAKLAKPQVTFLVVDSNVSIKNHKLTNVMIYSGFGKGKEITAYDDGTNGDKISQDGIFTARYAVREGTWHWYSYNNYKSLGFWPAISVDSNGTVTGDSIVSVRKLGALVDVTFKVNMGGQTVSKEGVYVKGDFMTYMEKPFDYDWMSDTLKLNREGSTDIYSNTFKIYDKRSSENFHFIFSNGKWNASNATDEYRDFAADGCGDSYQSFSRALDIKGKSGSVVLPAYLWNSCATGNYCASGTVTWDGGSKNSSAFIKENWSGDKPPCSDANLVFDKTSSKTCVIPDTFEIANITAAKAYGNRIRVSGKNTILMAKDINIQGSLLNVDAICGRVSCNSLTLTDNAFAESSEIGMDVSSLLSIASGTFAGRNKATINIKDFSMGRMGMFKSPSGTGIVSCTGNFSRHSLSSFDPKDGLWQFIGDKNTSLDPGVDNANPVRIQFYHLTIAKTGSNTLSISGSDTIQVNGNFTVNGTNSRVQGGVLSARGNITMGQAFSDGSFNRVLITGTTNQTITCDNAAEFSETVVINKASGKVLLGKDLSLGSLRFSKGILDPNGKKLTLTGNDISGQNNSSNIKDRAYVLKTDGAFSGNSITVPLSNGNGSSLNSISLNTTGTHNDWQLDYVAANPSNLDKDLSSDLSAISSTGYWRVQRLTSGAGSSETFLKILAASGFNRVALLDGGQWRSIGGSVSGSSITSTEGNLFAGTGDWYITAGKSSAPAPNPLVTDKEEISGAQIELEKAAYSGTETQANGSMLQVSPNPAEQFINVQLPAGAQRYTISDFSGRVLSSYPARKQQVSLQNLKKGIYILSTEVNGVKYSVRFMKED